MTAPQSNLPFAAIRLANGEPFPLYDEQSLYSDDEWKEAADYALATEDYDDLAFMFGRQRWFDKWCRLSEHSQDEWQGFENYWAKRRVS